MPEPTIKREREPRIDIIRGVAILTIVLNHLTQVVEFGGLSGWLVPTPTRYGYSTAAELFVIMSGYMVGLVYLARPNPSRAIWRRAGTLWLYDVALFVIVLPFVLMMTAAEQKLWGFEAFLSDPVTATVRFATLQKAPRLLDVLHLYILLMLVAPIAIAIQRRSTRSLIGLSVVFYGISQILIIRHIAAVPQGSDDGLLKLMSWQLLFFVPMALGAARMHVRVFRWLDRNWAMLTLLTLLYVIAAITYRSEASGGFIRPEWFAGRYGLHVLRLSHAILVLLLYASLLACAGQWLRAAPFRVVGTIGRHSLDCFAVGVVVTYVFGLLWNRVGGGHVAYYLIALLAVIVTAAAAYVRDRQRTSSAR